MDRVSDLYVVGVDVGEVGGTRDLVGIEELEAFGDVTGSGEVEPWARIRCSMAFTDRRSRCEKSRRLFPDRRGTTSPKCSCIMRVRVELARISAAMPIV
jgi:hypothetical protein